MDPTLYSPVFLYFTTFISSILILQYTNSPDFHLQEKKNNLILPLFICIFLVLWLGFRPVHAIFGDTVNYAWSYNLSKSYDFTIDWNKEWIWEFLTKFCKSLNLSVNTYFAIIEAGYILSAFWAIVRFVPNNPLLGMIFIWSSLMFFVFGTNGLRNGLACHIILLAFSYLLDSKYTIGCLICLIAFGIHKSTILPIVSFLLGFIFKNKVEYAIYIWLLSIPFSLVAGGAATSFFASLGFDDRMSNYTDVNTDMSLFSNTGFRWDFLFYSSFPVIMAWYVCIRRQISDSWYNVICITYCLCNAFWILVIRASYSNRFAYLSWFIYPLVIAYPLINLPVWNDQDRKTGLILLAYSGFTFFMNIVYW